MDKTYIQPATAVKNSKLPGVFHILYIFTEPQAMEKQSW